MASKERWSFGQTIIYFIFSLGALYALMLLVHLAYTGIDYINQPKPISPAKPMVGKFVIINSNQMPGYFTFLLDTETGQTWKIVGEQGNPAMGWQKMGYYETPSSSASH